MSAYNQVFSLLSGGEVTPLGWGFPPQPYAPRPTCALRSLLMFLSDDDGKAQLMRYYHGVIRSSHWAWHHLVGREEGYPPSMFFKPCFESDTLELRRSTLSGAMVLGWYPGPEVTTLTGQLDLSVGSTTLTLGNRSIPVQLQQRDDMAVSELLFPDEMSARLALTTPTIPSSHSLILRPPGFNNKAIAAVLSEQGVTDLDNAGVLEMFLANPRIEEKIAIAWVAVSKLESES